MNKESTMMYTDIAPTSYYTFPKFHAPLQIKYMLYDIKSYLGDRLFTKTCFSAEYYGLNLANPFVDNDFIKNTMMLNHKFKYYNGARKIVLKEILYKKLPPELLNSSKNGFGIPLKDWLYNLFQEDIIKLSSQTVLQKQGLFPIEKMAIQIEKLKNGSLSNREATIMFSYYMFQLWYKEHIEDLWK